MPETLTPLPERVTTPLLTLITQLSLDEDYQHVADRRRAGAQPPAGSARHRLTLAVVVVFGALVAVAGVQTARNADVTSAGRGVLVDRINTRRDALSDLEQRNATLRTGNAAAEDTYRKLGNRLEAENSEINRLGRTAGFATMTGAGVRVTVDDAPGGDPDAMVRDDDLALLVNGLLAAGARGVAINGHRWTALSAVRNTADVIRINDVSLSPPYIVEAVGENRTMQADLTDSTSGSRFFDLASDLGMPWRMDNVDSVQLPAAPERMLVVHDAREGSAKQPKPPLDQEDVN